jgi:aldehyde dehydrogenase (NAD+)
MISNTFDPQYIQVITGGVEVTQAILEHPFDYIFFTGSTRVGQIVYEKASKHLTPVTLELGGKSPVIIDETAHLKLAARRVAYGKVLNAGQTCIAPDYVYIKKEVKETFIQYLKEAFDAFTSDSTSLTHIVSERHIKRLETLINPNKVVYEGSFLPGKIKPYILDDVTPTDKVMQEEIFGPIIPIMTYQSIEEVIQHVKRNAKPLALYLFTENKEMIKTIKANLAFGGMAINDTILHITNPNLPFGGIGHSGIGHYTGQFSFETFSHPRGIMKSSTKIDLGLANPPYNKTKLKTIKRVLK